MCVGLAHKALLSQRCKTDQNHREARDWGKHALGHHAKIGLWKPLIVGGYEAGAARGQASRTRSVFSKS